MGTPRARAVASIRVTKANLAEFRFDGTQADGAWIRWVLPFVPDPCSVLARLAGALRPGARVAIHEYSAYENWQVLPRDPDFEQFVVAVIASWRKRGGEPNVGLAVPGWLEGLGFRVIATRTISHVLQRSDTRWQWPTSFALSGLERLIELGELDQHDGARIRSRLHELFAGDDRMVTPPVLETIAERLAV